MLKLPVPPPPKILPPTVVYIACDVSIVELNASTWLPSNSTSLPKSAVVGLVPLSTVSAELKMVSAPPGRTVRLEITCKATLLPALLRNNVFVYELVEPMVRSATVRVLAKSDEVVAPMVTVIGVVGARLVMKLESVALGAPSDQLDETSQLPEVVFV